MSTNISNQPKELSPAVKLAKQIKKEHFIKTALWVAGVLLTVIWIAFTIATSISTGDRPLGKEKVATDVVWSQLEQYWVKGKHYWLESDNGGYNVYKYTKMVDWNPLCLTYDPSLTGWYICVLLAPMGYLGIIYIIAYMKNMITPGAIKKTVRKALQFNYLKQKDVDYVVDEIDYNIGIKFRPEEVKDGEGQEPNVEDIFNETSR